MPTYTKEERELAQRIVEDASLMALLRKVMLPTGKALASIARQSITMPAEEYASLVKSIVLAEDIVAERFNSLALVARPVPKGEPNKGAVAPV